MTADEIKAIRASLGLTQGKFALALGVAVSTVRTWEQGQRNPGEESARRIRALASGPMAGIALLLDVGGRAANIAYEAYQAADIHLGSTDETTAALWELSEAYAAHYATLSRMLFPGKPRGR